MANKHDEIKNLLKASRELLGGKIVKEESYGIKKLHGLITESDDIPLDDENVSNKMNIAKSIENTIDNDEIDDEGEGDVEESNDDKKQGYRISGGIIVLHGKEQTDLELTTDEKIAFQETMDEFVEEVSNLVDFNKLNVYQNNVEWSGKIIEFDVEFFFSIGEENGLYLNGEMIRIDDKFMDLITKIKTFYDKFKNKWATIIASRKKTKRND